MTNQLFLSHFETLPEQLQRELASYMEFLMYKYKINAKKQETKPNKKLSERFYGCMSPETTEKMHEELNENPLQHQKEELVSNNNGSRKVEK